MRFDPAHVKRWRKTVWREFAKLGYRPVDLPAILVLAAVAGFGTDPSVLVEITGSSDGYVRKVLARLRKQGVLRGQTLRVIWSDQNHGDFGLALDAGVAAGIFSRPPDPKRSAAQRARAPETRARGPRKRATVAPGAIFTPKVQRANPLYGLPEWTSPTKP